MIETIKVMSMLATMIVMMMTDDDHVHDNGNKSMLAIYNRKLHHLMNF